jgi:hypothetical protein
MFTALEGIVITESITEDISILCASRCLPTCGMVAMVGKGGRVDG